MIDILSGPGSPWSDLNPSPPQVADLLAELSPEDQYDLGFSAYHERRAWEREAMERRARSWSLSMLQNMLTLAEIDGDEVGASRYRMQIAAVELGQECEETCRAIESVDDLRALIESKTQG